MEHALDTFFYVKGETEKEAVYLDLLLSLALYEIFLREIFGNHITPMMSVLSPVREPAEMEQINYDYEEVQNCTDLQKRKEMISELWEKTSEYFEKLCEISYAIYSMGYFAVHQSNYYALLRIIVLIEFVKFMQTRPNAYNAGCMLYGYTPMKLKEIMEISFY